MLFHIANQKGTPNFGVLFWLRLNFLHLIQRPDDEQRMANDILLGDGPDICRAAIQGIVAVIPHDEIAALRDGIGIEAGNDQLFEQIGLLLPLI